MKHVFHIFALAVLVAVVTGCGGVHRYDGRLVAADSLMLAEPDSALAIVSAIDTLAGEGDCAYRDLLVTQARYKCYADITASDDSAITRAMGYYRAHSGEREKLTRAFLYKGAVMEELGHVDSAMFYYKTAEATAAPKDYPNLGQINTRIARLFRDYYADPQICYNKYEQALKYNRLTDNKPQQIICLINMGGCSGVTRIGNSEKLLAQASQLAIELGDSAKFFKSQELLCRQLVYNGVSIDRAKQIALNCLNNYRPFVNLDLVLDLAEIYAKSGMTDSARYYIDNVTENAEMFNLEQVKARKYEILSTIARLEGDSELSNYYDRISHQVADSISNNDQKYKIQQIEYTFNNYQNTGFLSKISHLQWMIIGLAVSALLVIVSLLVEHLRRVRRTKAIIKEIKNSSPAHASEHLLNQFDTTNTAVGNLIANMVNILKACISESNMQMSTTQLADQIKESIVDVADDGFWNELRIYLDNKHNNMISVIADNPDIKKKDLKLIELTCCGLSYLEIALILDYSPRYVLNKRKNIARKLGLEMPLTEYLNNLMN